MIDIIQGDCLEAMKTFNDNQFDLVLTDPPYGIGMDKRLSSLGGTYQGNGVTRRTVYAITNWDTATPSIQYFNEMRRVSKNQIIFGGNYFVEFLSNSSCWIVWDKVNGTNSFADCELAWTSFDSPVRMKRYMWNGMLQGDMKNKEIRYHPTQKPTPLMRWCLKNYAKEGNTILDPFMGSGTTLRAAKDLGYTCTGIEIDPNYCKIAEERLRQQVLL